MRHISVVVYEADDYKKLDNMSVDEIIDVLNNIDDKWLPLTDYPGVVNNYEGNEDDYYTYKMHKALRLAIKKLEKERY